jgi:hypothetical protein
MHARAFRAIEVVQALDSAGLAARMTTFCTYPEHTPSNGSRFLFAASFDDMLELGNNILFLTRDIEIVELLQIQPDIIALTKIRT